MEKLAEQVFQQVGLRLNKKQLAALVRYEQELLEWNSRFNLTAIRDVEAIRIKHFQDSFTCLMAMRESPIERVIDVGTGAGFPGLVLKIAYPALQLTMVESVGKKAEFCRHMGSVLGMENVIVLQERAEAVGQMAAHREQYDWAIARAVASMPILVEYLLPLVRIGGGMIAMKGESGPIEAVAAEHAMKLLGGELRQLVPVALPGVVEERFLVVINKVAATPRIYPRQVGIPAKRPLAPDVR